MARLQGKGGQEGGSTISWRKFFFPRKIGNCKIFTGEEHMRLEFIY